MMDGAQQPPNRYRFVHAKSHQKCLVSIPQSSISWGFLAKFPSIDSDPFLTFFFSTKKDSSQISLCLCRILQLMGKKLIGFSFPKNFENCLEWTQWHHATAREQGLVIILGWPWNTPVKLFDVSVMESRVLKCKQPNQFGVWDELVVSAEDTQTELQGSGSGSFFPGELH